MISLKAMATKTFTKAKKSHEFEKLRTKAAILDELMELIEDKYLGYLMKTTEKEKNVPLSRTKKLLR